MTRWAPILFAAVFALQGAPAGAQARCGSHARIIDRLDMQYGESRRGGGLSGPQSVFEIWASDEPPYTWTILKVYPGGMACVMADGKNWQADPIVAPGDMT